MLFFGTHSVTPNSMAELVFYTCSSSSSSPLLLCARGDSCSLWLKREGEGVTLAHQQTSVSKQSWRSWDVKTAFIFLNFGGL